MAPTLEDLLSESGVVIIGNASREFKGLETREFASEQVVIDLAGLLQGKAPSTLRYHGICW
jgi:hypothetical protein